MEDKFEIDFSEFCFLVEACIPPRPIARSHFWDKVSDTYYHQMNPVQRKELFKWVQLNSNFDIGKEECEHFYDRFNPENQYTITTNYDGVNDIIEVYMHNGNYHTNKTTSIMDEYIIKIEKNGL